MQVHTFSIAARCPRTGMMGVAVSTAVPAVGGLCPHVRAGIGAVSTQAWVNPYLAFEALRLLSAGASAQSALDQALSGDAAASVRQIGMVDAMGNSAAWSGPDCTQWFGHFCGPGYAIQGNMLTGAEVLKAMEAAFRESEVCELGERLMLALEAGQRAGGDKRGKQSAALLVHDREEYPWIDLRADEHPYPVAELRRIYTIHQLQVRPFVEGMPKKGQPARPTPDSVMAMLLRSPPSRPGGGGSA